MNALLHTLSIELTTTEGTNQETYVGHHHKNRYSINEDGRLNSEEGRFRDLLLLDLELLLPGPLLDLTSPTLLDAVALLRVLSAALAAEGLKDFAEHHLFFSL